MQVGVLEYCHSCCLSGCFFRFFREMWSISTNARHFSPTALQAIHVTLEICCSSFDLPNPHRHECFISHKYHISQSTLQSYIKELLLYPCSDWKSWALFPKAWSYFELMPPFPTQLNMSNSLKALFMFSYVFVVHSIFPWEGTTSCTACPKITQTKNFVWQSSIVF